MLIDEIQEVGLLIESDGELHPIEIKHSASPRREWARALHRLPRLGLPLGAGAGLGLTPERIPLDQETWALPVGLI